VLMARQILFGDHTIKAEPDISAADVRFHALPNPSEIIARRDRKLVGHL
jgi:hypothetical protein